MSRASWRNTFFTLLLGRGFALLQLAVKYLKQKGAASNLVGYDYPLDGKISFDSGYR